MTHEEIKQFILENVMLPSGYPNTHFSRKYPEIYQYVLEYTSFLNSKPLSVAQRVYLVLNDIHEEANIIKDSYFNNNGSKKLTVEETNINSDLVGHVIEYFNYKEKYKKYKKKVEQENKPNISKFNKDELISYLKSFKNLYKRNGSLNGNIWFHNQDLTECIISHTPLFPDKCSISERVNGLLNSIEKRPICDCGNEINLFYGTVEGYAKFCSINCDEKKKLTSEINKGREVSQETKDKIKKVMLEKYGVDNYFKLSEFRKNNHNEELIEKRRIGRERTLKEKYGVSNSFQIESVKEKIRETNIQRYGVEDYNQKHFTVLQTEILNSKEKLEELHQKYSIGYMAKIIGVDSTTIGKYIEKHGIERIYYNETGCELVIKRILENLNVKYVQNDRKVLDGKEIDFYIPEHNLGIECNGLYWHSEIKRPEVNYHQDKFDKCKEKGIFLYQFWETEIFEKTDIIESMIKNKLQMNKKIYARKCEVKQISNVDASIFVTSNHLQSIKHQAIHRSFGLFFDDELVSVMTFNVAKEITINRFCSLKGINVIGGFRKLIKHCKNFFHNEDFFTFSDCRYSDGGLYSNSGFEKISKNSNGVDYWYSYDFTKLIHKRELRKQNIQLKYPEQYDENKTERQLAKELGYTRINSCKIYKWKL